MLEHWVLLLVLFSFGQVKLSMASVVSNLRPYGKQDAVRRAGFYVALI